MSSWELTRLDIRIILHCLSTENGNSLSSDFGAFEKTKTAKGRPMDYHNQNVNILTISLRTISVLVSFLCKPNMKSYNLRNENSKGR
jgi:hypothetical protein